MQSVGSVTGLVHSHIALCPTIVPVREERRWCLDMVRVAADLAAVLYCAQDLGVRSSLVKTVVQLTCVPIIVNTQDQGQVRVSESVPPRYMLC